ncbi:MAG: alpha/beta fold hydrolase [Candidatus Hermodarchaeota archaeon]
MPIFNYMDLDINYLKRGKGEPLLMFQGLGQSIGSWTFQIPFFKRRMMVIALDNRGIGKSSRPDYPYTMDMFIDETNALLEHLQIKDQLHVIGISMGGMIAQQFALKYSKKVKSLILLATAAYMNPKPLIDKYKHFKELSLNEAFKERLELMFSPDFIRKVQQDESLSETLKNKLIFENPPTMQDYKNRGAAIAEHDTRDLLYNITQPTLIITGSDDKIIPMNESRYLHEKIPNSKLEVIEGYGHGSLLIEDFERINNIIWGFIQENL